MKAIISDRSIINRTFHLATGKTICQGAHIKDVPLPTISPSEILVKVNTVTLNPIDQKYIDLLSPKGSRIGCDYAGTVTEVGSQAKGNWKVGDRVAGMVHGGLHPDQGSFAEYLKIDADLAWKIPEGVSDEVAATYGISGSTAMFALNVFLGVPWVDKGPVAKESGKKEAILIYSGSTAVGLFAIQLAKAAGLEVVTTASPGKSTEIVKEYGADAVFDYKSPTAVEEIRKQYPHITKSFDCISVGPSTHFCEKVMQGNEGRVVTLLDNGKSKVPGVVIDNIVIFTVFGEAWHWLPPIGPKFEVNSAHREAQVRFYANLPSMLGYYKAPPVEVLEGGIEAIFKGLDDYRAGKVSRKKLAVKIPA